METVKNFLKGVVISISQLVPGVSGGTIAMIFGIYDKLLHAVNNILKDFKNQYRLLLEVGLGAVIGIFAFSNIVKTLFDNFPIQIGYLFIGVILGGAPLMYRKAAVKGLKKSSILYLIAGFVIVYMMGTPNNDASAVIQNLTPLNFLYLFLGGVVVAIALILPGISGSFMLFVLGLYNTVITAVAQLNIPILIPIAIGGIVGTLVTARFIEILLLKFPEQTYILIFGFILGSVFSVFPGIDGMKSVIGIILAIIGFIFTYYISRN
ncbi:MAG: DUF368 domain-containing protein [Clostridiales bacterium]|uniref:DUF368 domain-containing protein n=1 Tax=Caproiciproducens sp. MSJ-32 TaxID=2841527 RepID=UPI001828DCD9|nr:DUF368 domain-containing protein [Caproiciproducens sp. MSJ-32]MBU5454105.1 DUF368 domain-containing protein [Caproiciproducens sp. MSJ-32]NLZ34216.1 DUF368 domain-containing protein [Clostridiales bacterium]